MFDLKKFTALAMAGTFAFGVAATTTYAATALFTAASNSA